MHEVSLAEEILRIVEASSLEEGFTRVENITLEIGQLAGVEPEALEFALRHMAPGSLLEGSSILLDQPPGSGYCGACAKRVSIEFALSPCPQCGHQPLSAIEGTSLRIKALEVL